MSSTKSYTYNHCVYTMCKNSRNLRKDPNIPKITFYTFPVKDKKRCKMWILNSGNSGLFNLPEDKLKYQVICERHFLNSSFRDFRAPLKYLNRYAVPIKYNSAGIVDEAHQQEQAKVGKEKKSFDTENENIIFSDWNITEETGKCPYCEFEFSSIDLKNRHVKVVHSQQLQQDDINENKNLRIICPLCKETAMICGTYVGLQKHLESSHSIKMEVKSLVFSSKEMCENWLKEQEIKTSYEMLTTIKYSDRVEKYFICNHNKATEYQSNYTHWNEQADGFSKMFGMCPSRLVVKFLTNGESSVSFWKTHVGHEEGISSRIEAQFISEANKIIAEQVQRDSTKTNNVQHYDTGVVNVKKEAASEDEGSSKEMEIQKVSHFLRNLDDKTYSKCMKGVIVPMMELVNHSKN